jgi:probable F420-dependent oxidoreductase
VPPARSFRFGVQAGHPPGGDPGDWAGFARRTEDLGFSSLFLPDHLGDQAAPIPALSAAAVATTSLKLGALVFGNDYRHPVILAKEVATLDVISGGRVEFGLGAGWMTTDYTQSGIALDPPGARIERMAEALAVCRGLWGDEPCTFEGRHYRVTDLDGRPKPVQRPHPRILIGGGRPRVLGFAAREADIVSINPSLHAGEVGPDAIADVVAERVDQKVACVREAAGDRFGDLELSLLVQMAVVVDNRAELVEAMAPGFGLTPAQALETPFAWIGTVEEICADVERWRDRWGISYWIVHGDAMEALAPVVAKLDGS